MCHLNELYNPTYRSEIARTANNVPWGWNICHCCTERGHSNPILHSLYALNIKTIIQDEIFQLRNKEFMRFILNHLKRKLQRKLKVSHKRKVLI
jgi:hypothetical protein